jgi:hypothetical protein
MLHRVTQRRESNRGGTRLAVIADHQPAVVIVSSGLAPCWLAIDHRWRRPTLLKGFIIAAGVIHLLELALL